MPNALITLILLLLPFDCASASTHQHNRLRDAEIAVTAWNGCEVTGIISGRSASLYMGASCTLRSKVPGTFRIRYDETCGAIVEITDGPVIATPMPPVCLPGQAVESANGTKGPTITDRDGAVWTLGPNQETQRNGVQVGGGKGSVYKYVSQVVYTLGTDNRWYRWAATNWTATEFVGANEPGGVAQPTPTPTPAPTPTPTPTTPTTRYVYETRDRKSVV